MTGGGATTATRQVDRTGLATLLSPPTGGALRPAGRPTGDVVCSPAGDVVAGLDADGRAAALDLTGRALAAAGVTERDRVLLAINVHGEGSGALLADASRARAAATAVVEPRGRARLQRAIRAVAPTTLVTTPTGAADLLSRLHLEFLSDPEELGLERIVVVGELAPPTTHRQLAAEFAVDLRELWCDPVFGAALAVRAPARDAAFTPVGDGLLSLAPLGPDEVDREWVLHPTFCAPLADVALRTGLVSAPGDGDLPAPSATVGDHVLVRGRWLALPALEKALAGIDGVAGWALHVSRDGTLDHARLEVGLARPSLVGNPMWTGRLADAVRSVTPVSVALETKGADEVAAGATVVDRRPQHLGRDRGAPEGLAPAW